MKSNKGKMSVGMQNDKGITLLALAVTIVVLLILTGIGIKLALGNNGIIGEAKNAKESAEIDEEKGIVKRATTVSLIKSKGSKVEQNTLEKALNDEAGEGKTDVSDAGDVFEVLFTDSNRYYEVDEEGNISDANKIIKDEYAGDITKGGRCDGSEEKPYEISCIEDLVAFSNIANGSGIKFENGQAVEILNWENFENKNIMLTKNLNFKSKFSYADSTRTDFGDINGDDTDGNMLITEMTTGTGFIPIGEGSRSFWGNFDGSNYSIENILILETENNKATGFFGNVNNDAMIKNLTITGKIESEINHTGGIVGQCRNDNSCTIKNCTNKANITGYNSVGGIIGYNGGNNTVIENCNNYGTITITGGSYGYTGAGGIAGSGCEEIINCINYGKISGRYRMGGIAALSSSKIINCINNGDIDCGESIKQVGGIAGFNGGKAIIKNCINTGNVTGYGLKRRNYRRI